MIIILKNLNNKLLILNNDRNIFTKLKLKFTLKIIP